MPNSRRRRLVAAVLEWFDLKALVPSVLGSLIGSGLLAWWASARGIRVPHDLVDLLLQPLEVPVSVLGLLLVVSVLSVKRAVERRFASRRAPSLSKDERAVLSAFAALGKASEEMQALERATGLGAIRFKEAVHALEARGYATVSTAPGYASLQLESGGRQWLIGQGGPP